VVAIVSTPQASCFNEFGKGV
jgi:hypothetical protein